MAEIHKWNPLEMSFGDESFGSSSSTSCVALSAPIPMANRIAAYKPPTHNLPNTLRSTNASNDSMSDKIDELANRIATFQNSKTTTNGDDRKKKQPTMKDIVFQSPPPSRRPISTRLFPSEAIPSEKIRINEMGFPTTSSEVPTCALTPTWKATGSLENKIVMSSDELKFSAAILTQSPQVISEKYDEDDLEAVEITVIKLDDEEEVNGSNGDDNNVKEVEKDCINSSAELPIFTYYIPPKGGVCKKLNVPQAEMSGQNATTKNASYVSISFDSLPAEYLDTTWNLSPEQYDISAIKSDDEMDSSDDAAGKSATKEEVNEASESLAQRPTCALTPTWKATGSLENKIVMSSDELKFSAAILTQSPQVISEKYDEDDLEAVEITVIKLDDEEEVNGSNGDDNNVKEVEKDCINSSAELSIFTHYIPPKGGVCKKLNISEMSGQNATTKNASHASISFDSLPAEYLDTTWNLSPEKSNDQRDVSAIKSDDEMDPSDNAAGKSASKEDVKEASESLVQRRTSSLISKARALHAKRAERQVKVEVTENQSLECSIEEYKDLPRDLFQQYDQKKEELQLPNEDLVSPTGVDNFVTDEDASKFNFANEKNETVISAITRLPEETTFLSSDYPYSIEGESLQDRSVDTITLHKQKGDIDCFDATKFITSKKALIGVIETSLGLIADKFTEGYDYLVASEL